MLNIENLSVAYGGLNALSGLSLAVTEGQFIAIVGPNGAGKTTLFRALTVLENLEMGAYPQNGRQEWARNIERIYALFPVLAERRHQLAGTLSGGEQQMLAIG